MIELSDGIEKSLNNRKLRDIVETYIRKVYDQDIYRYFNINRYEYEKSFDIIFPYARINEFLKEMISNMISQSNRCIKGST